MKRKLTIPAAIIIALTVFVPLAAQTEKNVANISFSPGIYRVGERLTYNVSFSSFINAAHIDLFVANGGTIFDRPGLELRAHIETTEVINVALYSINNDYTSFIDPATGIPFRSTQVIREGGNASDIATEYNAPVGADAIPNKLRMGEFPGRFDFLAAIYRIRALPLSPRSTYYFNVVYDQIEYKMQLKVVGEELVKTKVGSFNAVITELRTSASTKLNDYKVRVYFSDDERHVPVLITARYKVGDIRAELAGSQLPEGPPQTLPQTGPATVSPTPRPTPVTPQRPTTRPTPQPPTKTTGGGGSTASLPNLPFSVGEQLNFNFYLANSPQVVGTSSFNVKGRSKYFGRDGLLLAFSAQSSGALQRLFAVNDQINSYVDLNTLVPYRTEMNLQEGKRRMNQTLTIDQERGTVVTDKGARIDIPVGTHDLISVFYALRSFNLTPTRRTAVSILVENRPRTLFITAIKRETIELGTQKVPAIQLSLTTDDPQADRYGLRLWVSDDRRRLPLRITATTQLGAVRADLAIIPVIQQ